MRRPIDLYPAQVISGDPGYPHGKARNVLVLNDGTGTPLEEKWLNDVFGAFQALLVAAGITPNGAAETALSSQILDAILYFVSHPNQNVFIDGNLTVDGRLETTDFAKFHSLVTLLTGLDVTGVSTFRSPINVLAALTAQGIQIPSPFGMLVNQRGITATAAGTSIGTLGDIDLQLPVAMREPFRLATGGRLIRQPQTVPNSDATLSVSNGDRIIIPASVSGGHIYNLSESDAESGAELRVINWSIYTHTIQSGGTPVLIMPPDNGSALPNTWRPASVDFLFHSNGLVSRWLPGPVTLG